MSMFVCVYLKYVGQVIGAQNLAVWKQFLIYDGIKVPRNGNV